MERSLDEIINKARNVDWSVWQRHVREFVSAFVTKAHQDHWSTLLLKATEETRRTFHTLRNDLDATRCAGLKNPWSFNPDQEWVYVDFSQEPKYLTFEDSMYAASMYNGLFSLVPGQLALVFFEDGEIPLCDDYSH